MEISNLNQQEQNNHYNKNEEHNSTISTEWIINGWDDSQSIFDYEFPIFQDKLHFSTIRKNGELFEIAVELKHPFQVNQYLIKIIINNKDPKNSISQCKMFTFSQEPPIQSINFPINCEQLTEENGFNTSDKKILIKIEITRHQNINNRSLILPIINPNSNTHPPPPPYSGLKNQGSTCYMNSILQSLFHLPLFKSIIYRIDTTSDTSTSDDKNIPLNLQRLFGSMQLTKGPCSTIDLTKSFGWDAQEIFMQQDAQEFCRKFLENLEKKMEGTDLEGAIPSLFRGKSLIKIQCRNVPYQNLKEEDFYDISLDVKESSTLEESFQKTIENDPLIGDNQYDAGPEYGKQDADMTAGYVEFPKVLQIHLRRFMFEQSVKNYVKLNKRFSFPEIVDLAPYRVVNEPETEGGKSLLYQLFGVLVHWGTIIGGHYYAYIRTTKDGKWYEFNDAKVSEVSPEVAIEGNFGGPESVQNQQDGNDEHNEKCSTQERLYSAYMLIYVKQDAIDEVFNDTRNEEVPEHIVKYIKLKEEEEKAFARQQYEKENTINTPIVLDKVIEIFAQNNQIKINVPYGYDEPALSKNFQIKKYDTFKNVYVKSAALLNKKLGSFILFPIFQGKISRALPISDNCHIYDLNPIPNGFLFRERKLDDDADQRNVDNHTGNDGIVKHAYFVDMQESENQNDSSVDNKNEQSVENQNIDETNKDQYFADPNNENQCNPDFTDPRNEKHNFNKKQDEQNFSEPENGNQNFNENQNINENKDEIGGYQSQNDENTEYSISSSSNEEEDEIDLEFNDDESNIIFVLSYFRSISKSPLHFVFTKQIRDDYSLTNLHSDFRQYFKLDDHCKLATFKAINYYQVEPYNNEDLSQLVSGNTPGAFLVIQPIDEYVNVPCCYMYRDMVVPSYDDEEEEEEYVSYVKNFMKENPNTIMKYLTCHYQTVQISVQTSMQSGSKTLIAPYIITYREMKLFISASFSLEYDERFDSMLIFPNGSRHFITLDKSDDLLSMAELVHNLNYGGCNENKLMNQLSFTVIVVKDTSIDCLYGNALFAFTNALNTSSNDLIHLMFPDNLTVSSVLLYFAQMFHLSDTPIRLIAIMSRKAYWISKDEHIVNINFPLRLEFVPESQRNLDPTDLLISVIQFKVTGYQFLSDKNAFNQIDDGDPYLFRCIRGEKFCDTKVRICLERNFNEEIQKNLRFFLLNTASNEKEHILLDDDVLTDLMKHESFLYFGPTNQLTTTNYRVPKESAINIYN